MAGVSRAREAEPAQFGNLSSRADRDLESHTPAGFCRSSELRYEVREKFTGHERARQVRIPLRYCRRATLPIPSRRVAVDLSPRAHGFEQRQIALHDLVSVSYTHLTLPTNREV